MTEEQEDNVAAVSEQPNVESQEQNEEPKMVPLAAMLATREKLREAELRAAKAEAAQQTYQEYLMRDKEGKKATEEEEDPTGIVEKAYLKEANANTKRDILETLYQDMNPEAVQKINKYLKPILEKKPWLATSVDSAQNRYARAYEIVQDYIHLVEEAPLKKSNSSDGRKIVENAHKPRSPAEVGKSAQPSGSEYLKSIQGKKEFREYRQKLLQG